MNAFFERNRKEIISIILLFVLIPLILLAGLSKTINELFSEIYTILFTVAISLIFIYGIYEIYFFVLKKNSIDDSKISSDIEILGSKKNLWTFLGFAFIYWFLYMAISLYFVIGFFNDNLEFRSKSQFLIFGFPILLMLLSNIYLTIDSEVNIKDQIVITIVSTLLMIFFMGFVYILVYHSFATMFLILISTSLNDMSAYFFGKRWGKAKLAPKISPNKTQLGFLSGITASIIFGFIWYLIFIFPDYSINFMEKIPFFKVFLIIFIVALTSPMGDLFFSKIKREYDKKDYGNLIPDHGGLLDRIDSHIFTTVSSLVILMI